MSAPALAVETVHVCSVEERDRRRTEDEALYAAFADWSARDVALSTFDWTLVASWCHIGWLETIERLAVQLRYTDHFSGRNRARKKRIPMADVDDMVAKWRDAILHMCAAHTHAGYTLGERATDDLLSPLLIAPLEQIRAFATKLKAALEADDRVPFLVWSTFARVIDPLVQRQPEGEIIRLKTKLATEVATLVEKTLPRADLIDAMAGALKWRDSGTLEQVKTAVQAGATPKITGRQSCLFLSVHDPATARKLAEVIL